MNIESGRIVNRRVRCRLYVCIWGETRSVRVLFISLYYQKWPKDKVLLPCRSR